MMLISNNATLYIKKSTLRAFLAIVLLKITLDLAYYLVISHVYGYTGLTLNPNILKIVESFALLIIVFMGMPKAGRKLSTIFIWLMVLVSYVPMLTYFAFADEERLYIYAVTGCWLIVFLLMRIHLPVISLPPLKQAMTLLYSIFTCLGVIVFIMIWINFGLLLKFDLSDVYVIRSAYELANIPMAGYLFAWMATIVNPVFFALFIRKRIWFPVVMIVLLQSLLFATTGHRLYLFALPFTLVMMWIVNRKNTLPYMIIGLLIIIILSMLSYMAMDNLRLSSLFTFRTLIVPAQISFYYYDFFSQHDFVFLASSRLGSLIDYPYELSPPYLIGQVYYNDPDISANTGIYGDAYMNFGFAGMVVYSFILAIILRLIDICARGADPKIGAAAISVKAISLTNGALTTVFVTGGLWLAILILYLLPKEHNSKVQKERRAD